MKNGSVVDWAQKAFHGSLEALQGAENGLKMAQERIQDLESKLALVRLDERGEEINERWAAEASATVDIRALTQACIFTFERVRRALRASRGETVSGYCFQAFKLWVVESGALDPNAFDKQTACYLEDEALLGGLGDLLQQLYHTLCISITAMKRDSLTSQAIANIKSLLSELDMLTFRMPRSLGTAYQRYFRGGGCGELQTYLENLVREQKIQFLAIRGPEFNDWPEADFCQNFDKLFPSYSSTADQKAQRDKVQSRLIQANLQRRRRLLEGGHDTPRDVWVAWEFALHSTPEQHHLDEDPNYHAAYEYA
ncbi:unnamed protein product [Clonostachys rosea]|uniref:Uncharacterized protein n=1 Tax=Bionectria ochroleuca TaxID=29856 RepID=A0ABY6ULT4_BIOOC|nr:unnamed protein product [Clonostachys rosea]